ncbi:hypothetical protein L486_02499 [Kwoniella mangroviensis CBS 10435]|uniref:Secreted protein n=1 Tax=Kwoniella mangroviensis CBS 10435 TaxID=1331196 RepID=A0A1B9IWC8_9TREE|nr:hypothetical protein L486_02499 [Kwoniella mangroviensis CBS 10435]
MHHLSGLSLPLVFPACSLSTLCGLLSGGRSRSHPLLPPLCPSLKLVKLPFRQPVLAYTFEGSVLTLPKLASEHEESQAIDKRSYGYCTLAGLQPANACELLPVDTVRTLRQQEASI